MFVHAVPNRNSPPALLLHKGYREDGKIKMSTVAKLRRLVDERYRLLQKLSRNFRILKDGFLEIRHIYLQKAARTQAHALICMLALKIVNEATASSKQTLLPVGDGHVRCLLDTALRTMGRVTFDRYNVNGIEFLRLPNPDEHQIAVCKALGVPLITHRSQAVC